ncbi:transcription factor bHLH140 [Cryptomeria japonica]|uniref:transcription factor bHLH140 n=1 Tax=Cryptomeria japonica TaxID=3369 RepID=UPI0027DAA903|nr:transcription factor bHLH140 [Cryptomeria japonica]
MASKGDSGPGSMNCRSLVVVLIGPPASGKSTFCERVIEGAHRPWIRICQDIISNGKRGNKAQCLMQASMALNEGQSVFIDCCNMTKQRRHDFVELAGPQIEVHAIELDLPAKICISRIAKRTAHEGGLQGGKAAMVINSMLKNKESPNLDEGFSRIMSCQTEADVENAINMYKELGPADHLPSGIYGKKSKDDKFQSGMLRFFKKEKDVHDGHFERKSTELLNGQEMIHNNPKNSDGENSKQTSSSIRPQDRTAIQSSSVQSYGSVSSETSGNDCIPTLAFPSISTADFHFDHEKAADIIVDRISEFLMRYKTMNFKLVLVDLTKNSDMLRRVHSKAAEKGLDSKRFYTFVGDITKLYTEGGLKCSVIANAANWRLKAGGGGVNAAIFKAAGPELEVATKERAKALSPGSAVVVPLSSGCPLYKNEGVTNVIHVLGPNMNPQRPNCLKGDYAKGCQVLHDTYSSLFESFISICKAQQSLNSNQELPDSDSSKKETSPMNKNQVNETKFSDASNAFAVLMQSSKKNSSCVSDKKTKLQELSVPEGNKRFKLDTSELLISSKEHALTDEAAGLNSNSFSRCFSGYRNDIGSTATHKDKIPEQNIGNNGKGKKSWESWAKALHETALHPEQNNRVLEVTDSMVVFPDLYPKAKKHLLVVARLHGLDSLADVQKEHLPLLREIHSMGEKWVASFLQEDPISIFRLGYHSVPSMQQLHLHVISQDFDSVYLKNKKHWNSFTTKFFRDSVDVLEEVEKFGRAEIIYDKDILSKELRCHRCRSAHPNIPRLKSHISTCKSPFPASLSQGQNLFSMSPRESCFEIQARPSNING